MHKAFSLSLLLCLGVVSVSCGPSPSKEGLKWSHGELITHLKSKGLEFAAKETNLGGFYGPAMYFTFFSPGGKVPTGQVYVQIRKSEQEAKDAASLKGEKAFWWGRFYFECGDPYQPLKDDEMSMSKIKEVLK